MSFRLDHASAALPLILLLLAITFIVLIATSLIASDTTSTEEDLQQYVDDAINELTSYIKIQQVYGSFTSESPYHLSKIVIQATPLFEKDINLSSWIIQIQTKSDLRLYTISKNISSIGYSSVFMHEQWNNLSSNNFGVISILDIDESLEKYHSFSEPSDIAFFTLPVKDLLIEKGDKITLVLSPAIGIKKTISFKVPLPIEQVVTLW